MKLMNKEEITKAAKQLTIIQNKYPEFHRMFTMIVELNNISNLKDLTEQKVILNIGKWRLIKIEDKNGSNANYSNTN